MTKYLPKVITANKWQRYSFQNNVPDTKAYFLFVIIFTTSYITINNNSYQVLSIHSTLSIQSYLLLTATLQDTFIFPILQRGNGDSENSKCIILSTPERTNKQKKNLYHFKSLLAHTISMKSLLKYL